MQTRVLQVASGASNHGQRRRANAHPWVARQNDEERRKHGKATELQ
jgi:hypothetical protein